MAKNGGNTVQAEMEEGQPLAVIFNGGDLGEGLGLLLKKQKLRVLRLVEKTEALPVLEKPSYIFFFASRIEAIGELRQKLSEALSSAARVNARLMVISWDLAPEQQNALDLEVEKSGWKITRVMAKGRFSFGDGNVADAAGKLVHAAFSGGKRVGLTLLGEEEEQRVNSEVPAGKSVQDVIDRLNYHLKERKGKKISRDKGHRGWPVKMALAGFWGIMVFLIWVGGWSLVGAGLLTGAYKDFTRGNFEQGTDKSKLAEKSLSLARVPVDYLTKLGIADQVGRIVRLGEDAAGTGQRVGKVAPMARELARGLLGGDGDRSTDELARELVGELPLLDQRLGAIEGEMGEIAAIASKNPLLTLFGVSKAKIMVWQTQISNGRELLQKGGSILSVLGKLTGSSGKRAYLLVFQNSSELRPTGGFIGSYAVVKFENGKILDFKVNDVYTADGQLRGHVQPPDEILHYLGQPAWYMRDANWAVDFPLTASRLEWFLEKETGERVDGVIGVSLPMVEKMLAAVGPLTVNGIGEPISAENFYQRAEYASEINFFAGSNQKKDFLGAVATAMSTQITAGKELNWVGLGGALNRAVAEKDVLLYFNDDSVQRAFTQVNAVGKLEMAGCQAIKNCLMIVEANLGANKANYFLKRNILVQEIIGKGGEVDNKVTIVYRNDSPGLAWPGGNYKNYLRLLVPRDSQVTGLDLGDGRRATFSATLTADVLAKVDSKHFLVFRSPELSLEATEANRSVWESLGVLVEVEPGKTKTVVLNYRPKFNLNLKNRQETFNLWLFKQPGYYIGEVVPVDLEVEYPSFLTPVREDQDQAIAQPQRIIYNTDLSEDRKFQVKFQRD